MSGEDEFTPHLGKLRDQGTGGTRRFRSEITRAARHLSPGARTRAFSGAQLARGSGATRD